ncbi:MAG: GGDEF domain-containing phosphodiesterase [Lachnospiraceae bacterium]|nr:GGDEF domain-containing phosphodiesterase [Lachnospiraceae bacterium]
MKTKKVVSFLDKLQEYDQDEVSLQSAIGILASSISLVQVQALFEDVDMQVAHFDFYQKSDSILNNQADYEEKLSFDGEKRYLTLRYWKEQNKSEDTEEEKNVMQMMSRILVLYFAKYQRKLRDENAITHDVASGALNTTGFVTEGQKIIAKDQGCKYTALYLNISKFKLINQMYGHEFGNLVLSAVARNMKDYLYSFDEHQLLGRIGGDNYVVLVKDQYLNLCLEHLDNFKLNISYDNDDICLLINFFVGVYQIKEDDQEMYQIIEKSSEASSIAKNRVSFEPVYYDQDLHRQIVREKEIESNMRQALENKEFVVYYQPKIDLNTYRLNGAEALVRWIENGKIVPPMEFIPVFEKNGFICNMDFYVLDIVCRDITEWLKVGIDLFPISVNFSKVHFLNPGFTEQIIEVLKKYYVPARYIEIEFTETVDYKDKATFVRAVETLKSFGISTSIDDFGTGFSSLSLLKTLPVDMLKIDKSLLDVQTSSEKERVIISNVVRMVKEMDIQVITEGVETKEQADFLKEIKCDNAQGFLFDRPLPKEQFEKRLKKGYYEGEELKDV